jgi:hypothetical protein
MQPTLFHDRDCIFEKEKKGNILFYRVHREKSLRFHEREIFPIATKITRTQPENLPADLAIQVTFVRSIDPTGEAIGNIRSIAVGSSPILQVS